jgi:hypothetical protein
VLHHFKVGVHVTLEADQLAEGLLDCPLPLKGLLTVGSHHAQATMARE